MAPQIFERLAEGIRRLAVVPGGRTVEDAVLQGYRIVDGYYFAEEITVEERRKLYALLQTREQELLGYGAAELAPTEILVLHAA